MSRVIEQYQKACEYLAGGVVDMSPLGRDEMNRRGIPAEHFQLGYTSKWDSWGGASAERPVDVMHLGTEAPRRRSAHM